MGRSFESVRMGAAEVSARWARAGRAMKKEDQGYAQELIALSRQQCRTAESLFNLFNHFKSTCREPSDPKGPLWARRSPPWNWSR